MLPDKSGIYMIINRSTEKVYVGSAVNLRKRCNSHFSKLTKGVHHSIKLQRSFNKHGIAAFSFFILEYATPSQLVEREQYWLSSTRAYRTGYNMQPIAGSSLGIKRSESFKEKCRQRMLGTSQTVEQVLKRKARGIFITDAQRYRRPVVQLEGSKVIGTYGSIKEASVVTNIDSSSITAVCKKKPQNKTAGGYIWKYAA